MFNQFEGNADERLAKQEERLRLLKNLRASGYFDEEGTEEVTVKATGINPCDLGHGAFTGEQPFLRPKGATLPFIRDEDGRPRLGVNGRLLRDKRKTIECWLCQGLGSLEPEYGDSTTLERCPECDGSGRLAVTCAVCRQLPGGGPCAACNGLWE